MAIFDWLKEKYKKSSQAVSNFANSPKLNFVDRAAANPIVNRVGNSGVNTAKRVYQNVKDLPMGLATAVAQPFMTGEQLNRFNPKVIQNDYAKRIAGTAFDVATIPLAPAVAMPKAIISKIGQSSIKKLGAYGALRGVEGGIMRLGRDLSQGEGLNTAVKNIPASVAVGFGANTLLSSRLLGKATDEFSRKAKLKASYNAPQRTYDTVVENGVPINTLRTDKKSFEMSNSDFKHFAETGKRPDVSVNDYKYNGKVKGIMNSKGEVETWTSDNQKFVDEMVNNGPSAGMSIKKVEKSTPPLSDGVKVISKEDYLNQNGGAPDWGDAGLHKTAARISQKVRDRQVKQVMAKDSVIADTRARLSAEYDAKVASGELRTPTRTDSLIQTAQGNPELESVQAARRVLDKKGISYSQPLSSPPLSNEAPAINLTKPTTLTTNNGMNVDISNPRTKTISVQVGNKPTPVEAKIFEHDGVTLALFNEKPLGGSSQYILADPKTGAFISSGQSEAGAILHAKTDNPAYWEKVKTVLSKNDGMVTPKPVTPATPKPMETATPKVVVPKATRSFTQTTKQSEFVSPEVTKNIKDQVYNVRNTEELGTKAKNLVDKYPNIALEMAKSNKVDDQVVAVSTELIKKYSYSKNLAEVEQAIDLTESLTEKLTKAGQTVQAASLINRLSPEGILVFTQRQLNKAAQINPKFVAKLEPTKALELTELTKKIQAMPEGYAKAVETAQLYKKIRELIPASLGKKIATIQTLAQLLNPKTLVRNLVGNVGFGAGLENISQVGATAVDNLVSKFTGKKTVALPSLIRQAKGVYQGGIKAGKEALLGVDTQRLGTQFDLNQVPVFKNKMLQNAEKALNLALKAPDRAAYSAAFDDTLQGLMKKNNVTKADDWMMEAAHQTGLYRTFQDESNTAKLFTTIKKGLNFGKDFGLGDFVLKYPKTPANLISRAIDYSPAGYLKSLYNLAFIKNPTNQREFAMSLARATTGTTSLVGLGALLGGAGIITEAPEKDTDLRNLQKKVGLGGYQINLSALKRYFNSGFDTNAAKLQPEDTLVTYDWFQPAAVGISMGAKIAKNLKQGKSAEKDLASIITESITGGVETLAEQPLVRGVRNLALGYGGVVENLKNTATGSLASFVPTLLNQIGQLTDTQDGRTKVRDVSSLGFIDETLKKAQTKVPRLRNMLPQSVDVMGDPMVYNSKAGLMQSFVTPYFLSNYQPNAQIQELFSLMDVTGEKKQFPRTVDKSVTINGNKKELNPEEKRQYQTYVGQTTDQILEKLLNDPAYTSLDDTTKVNKISNILTDINAAAKIELFGNQPTTVDSGVRAILAGSYYLGKTPTQVKTTTKKTSSRSSKGKKPSVKITPTKQSVSLPTIKKISTAGLKTVSLPTSNTARKFAKLKLASGGSKQGRNPKATRKTVKLNFV